MYTDAQVHVHVDQGGNVVCGLCVAIVLVGRAGASPPSRTTGPRCLYVYIYPWSMYQIPLISKCLYVNLF